MASSSRHYAEFLASDVSLAAAVVVGLGTVVAPTSVASSSTPVATCIVGGGTVGIPEGTARRASVVVEGLGTVPTAVAREPIGWSVGMIRMVA